MDQPPKLPAERTDRRAAQPTDPLSRLIPTLQTWPWLATLRILAQRFRDDRLGITASSLTFTTLISLVPLITVMLAVFSAFPMFSQFQGAVQRYLLQSLIPDTIARPVLGALTQFATQSSRLGGAGLAVLVFTALALMLTIDRTLNSIWRVRKPRPIAQRVLVYWAALTLGPVLLGISLTLTSYALTASRGMVAVLPGGVALLLNLLEFALLAVGIAGLFHYVPNTDVRWRHALVGGVFVSAGFELAKRGLTLYLDTIPTYSLIYGAFATLPIFLIWLYLGWVIVLLGAVIAAYAPSVQMRVVGLAGCAGAPLRARGAAAAAAAAGTSSGRRAAWRCTGCASSCGSIRCRSSRCSSVLLEIDLIGRLDEASEARFVLLVEPQRTGVGPLVSQLLVAPTPELTGFWQRPSAACTCPTCSRPR